MVVHLVLFLATALLSELSCFTRSFKTISGKAHSTCIFNTAGDYLVDERIAFHIRCASLGRYHPMAVDNRLHPTVDCHVLA